jgi:hypothetical protein
VAPEWWSSVTAKDQDQRPISSSFTQMEMVCAIQRKQSNIWRIIAGMKLAAMHVGECVTDKAVNVFRAPRHEREAGETQDKDPEHGTNSPLPRTCHHFHRSKKCMKSYYTPPVAGIVFMH